jgi:hypothetical protein
MKALELIFLKLSKFNLKVRSIEQIDYWPPYEICSGLKSSVNQFRMWRSKDPIGLYESRENIYV